MIGLIRFGVSAVVLSVLLTVASGASGQTVGATGADLNLPDGFRAELLYTVPKGEQGSWVSMTFDNKGRVIASDQYGSLYRITVPALGASGEASVEKLEVDMGMAQGLLYAFDSLYAMVNGNAADGGGLYRLRDTNGDDQYDSVEHLISLASAGEHGPHAIVLAPDGRSLYVVAGNHTPMPEFTSSASPQVWDEDQLLPRMPDAGGHATTIMAPGGWIMQLDADGGNRRIIANGFRNTYDIAFNRLGELFAYDSDMEWDVGSPWYRPTRVNLVTSGAEFGWRNGSGKWPAYYPDSLDSVVDIGPGSPTGVTFGYGTKFPAKYQEALFICDWSFGKLYAVHLTPNGAGYTGEAELFASASPLPLTDIAVGPDGALYFTVGGRRVQSALYRVVYSGGESAAPSVIRSSEGARPRELRHAIERYHRTDSQAVGAVWPHLSSEDREVRYAARVAVEHQPVTEWQANALNEKRPAAAIESLLALTRHGDNSVRGDVIAALNRIDYSSLEPAQRLALLRVYGLAFIRLGEPNTNEAGSVIAKLDPFYPASTVDENVELSRLLGYLEAPGVIGKTLKLLADAPTQEEQIHYVYVLRTISSGWSLPQRRALLGWFNEAARFGGGNSFSRYLANIEQEIRGQLNEVETSALQDVLNAERPQPGFIMPKPFVENWSVDDLVGVVSADTSGRDLELGQKLFADALCSRCHRFAGRGGAMGPDLTGAGGRFTPRDLLESIIDPSKEISDQYGAVSFEKKDGSQVVGRVVNLNGDRISVMTNPYVPGALTNVNRDDVVKMERYPVSQMPPGLLNSLTKEEVADLMAYIMSGGGSR